MVDFVAYSFYVALSSARSWFCRRVCSGLPLSSGFRRFVVEYESGCVVVWWARFPSVRGRYVVGNADGIAVGFTLLLGTWSAFCRRTWEKLSSVPDNFRRGLTYLVGRRSAFIVGFGGGVVVGTTGRSCRRCAFVFFVWATIWSGMRVSDFIVGFWAAYLSDTRVFSTSTPVVRVVLSSVVRALFCRRCVIEVVVGVSTVFAPIPQ